MTGNSSRGNCWVISHAVDDDVAGRIGDARELADRHGVGVTVLSFDATVTGSLAESWIHHGADEVQLWTASQTGSSVGLLDAVSRWKEDPPSIIICSADRVGRAWAARLAGRTGWPMVSSVLLVRRRERHWLVTRLHESGRWSQSMEFDTETPVIVVIKLGVAQPLPANPSRTGSIRGIALSAESPATPVSREHLPADPRVADIRHVSKLIAGGRGVGGKAGFAILRRIGAKLGAGVAASRMAVDLGWIEHDRQVGQTGKTVRPELYIACGISGASHHCEGMAESRHVVAINTDPQAPLLQIAELGLQADLHQVLQELERLLESTT